MGALSLRLFLLAACLASAAALELVLESERSADGSVFSRPRCVVEELTAGGLAVINWEATGGKVAVKVTAPNGTVVKDMPHAEASHLGFQAAEAGDYRACFEVEAPEKGAESAPLEEPHAEPAHEDGEVHPAPPPPVPPPAPGGVRKARLQVSWLTGVGAQLWAGVAKREHMKEVTANLAELEEQLRAVYAEMLAMREREQAMRDVSEGVNGKVAYLSIASLAVSSCLAVWQLAHMKVCFWVHLGLVSGLTPVRTGVLHQEEAALSHRTMDGLCLPAHAGCCCVLLRPVDVAPPSDARRCLCAYTLTSGVLSPSKPGNLCQPPAKGHHDVCTLGRRPKPGGAHRPLVYTDAPACHPGTCCMMRASAAVAAALAAQYRASSSACSTGTSAVRASRFSARNTLRGAGE